MSHLRAFFCREYRDYALFGVEFLAEILRKKLATGASVHHMCQRKEPGLSSRATSWLRSSLWATITIWRSPWFCDFSRCCSSSCGTYWRLRLCRRHWRCYQVATSCWSCLPVARIAPGSLYAMNYLPSFCEPCFFPFFQVKNWWSPDWRECSLLPTWCHGNYPKIYEPR